MNEILNIDQLIAELRSITAKQAQGVDRIHELELVLDESSQRLDIARAKALLSVVGKNVEEKKAAVDLLVITEREAFDLAKASHTYAKAKAKNYEMAQMSTQSQLTAVRATYAIGGN
jgi:hypothetical protein